MDTAKKEYDRRWYRENKERKLAYLKMYFENNPEKKRHKPKPPSSTIHVKTCLITGRLFIARNSSAKYSKEGQAIKARELATQSYHNRKVLTPKQEKQCDECGNSFTGHTRSRYCSPHCLNRVNHRTKRAKERAFPLKPIKESVGRYTVYTRHNGHCAICGIHTPYELVGTPNAPELDHIIPLTKGGSHTYSNIQLLCRTCNINKGDNVL